MFICDISVFNRFGKELLDDRLTPLMLTWRDLVALLVLDDAPGIRQSALSRFLQTDKANITKMLQGLEDNGWIRRDTDGSDQRIKRCRLTEEGQMLVPLLKSAMARWEESCFQDLTAEERAVFHRLSDKISKRLMAESRRS